MLSEDEVQLKCFSQLPSLFVVEGPEEWGDFEDHSSEDKKADVKDMTKCEHEHHHDKKGNVYNEAGTLVHGSGKGGGSDAKEKTKVEDMEKCKHGNLHDKDGAVYDASGEKIHGPGGHEEEEEVPHDHEVWVCADSYKAMHNMLAVSAPKILKAIDLAGHKSAVDLGGELP